MIMRNLVSVMAWSLSVVAGYSAAHASEVDPWLRDSLRPWESLTALTCTMTESRGSVVQGRGIHRVVNRTVTWTWSAEPAAFHLAIVGGPIDVLTEEHRNDPAVMRFFAIEFPSDWRTSAIAYGADRMHVFNAETGVITSQRLHEDLAPLAFQASTPLPLEPYRFLNAAATDDEILPRHLLLERLRNPAWVTQQWNLLEMRCSEQTPQRRVLVGSLPPEESGAERQPFEVIVIPHAETQIPVIAEVRHPLLRTAGLTYTTYVRADGTRMPICSGMTIPGIERDHVATMTAMNLDVVLEPEDLVIDVSQARSVFDADEGIEIVIDAGSP